MENGGHSGWAARRAHLRAQQKAERVAKAMERLARREARRAERHARLRDGRAPWAREGRFARPPYDMRFADTQFAGGDDCAPVAPVKPVRGRGRGRVNGPWAMHQLEESDRGPGPAIVAGVAQVVGCSLAAEHVPAIG